MKYPQSGTLGKYQIAGINARPKGLNINIIALCSPYGQLKGEDYYATDYAV